MFTKDEMVEEVITKMDEVVDEILVIDFNSRDEIFPCISVIRIFRE